eukprot:NODE_109_length_19684_cov_0.566709.p1 type:complete len:699 gc:universal NODE_109_length_19684_cov_0.566709:6203-4107(-)
MLLFILAMCVKYSDFRTFSNQFEHLSEYSGTIIKVECADAIIIHYSINDRVKVVSLHLTSDGNYIHIKATSDNDFQRYSHPLNDVVEYPLNRVNCEYKYKTQSLKVFNNILFINNLQIPLDSIIYQDKTVNHEYTDSFNSKTKIDHSLGFTIKHRYNHIYGFPEHTANLDHLEFYKDHSDSNDYLRLFNLDVFEFELNTNMGLYGSIPFYMGIDTDYNNVTSKNDDYSYRSHVSAEYPAYTAVFLNNPSDTFIKINNQQMSFYSESSTLDLYFFTGHPYSILNQYHSISGYPMLPQLFAISYHQCRWNYNNQQDVLEVNNQFNNHKIPVDVIWLDIEHTDGKRYLTWDNSKFNDPVDMLNILALDGRKMVTIVDPHIKIDEEYHVYANGLKSDLFVKDANNKVFQGDCWPGKSVWFDFLDPRVRQHWADLFNYNNYVSTSTLYTWNDMNEPSVFNSIEITMPKDNLHTVSTTASNNGQLSISRTQVQHHQIHNVYGLHQHMATCMGQIQRDTKSKRPFVLSRSFYAGTQQYGPIWTGDNKATWDHLKSTIPMLLQLQLAGLPFAGADVGGFFGNPDGELLSRWYQLAVYQPFFRAHAHIETARREPWLFPEYLASISNSIKWRYKLLPYLYTLFAENSANSLPIMHPLFIIYPFKNLFTKQDSWLLGESLLIHPVVDPGVTETEITFNELHYDFGISF